MPEYDEAPELPPVDWSQVNSAEAVDAAMTARAERGPEPPEALKSFSKTSPLGPMGQVEGIRALVDGAYEARRRLPVAVILTAALSLGIIGAILTWVMS